MSNITFQTDAKICLSIWIWFA